MKTPRKNQKRLYLFASCLVCLLAIPACVTVRHATPEAPFVINFEFISPIHSTPAEAKRFILALEKYAVRSATRISMDKKVIWPPPLPKVEKMKTDQVMKSEKSSSVHPDHPQHTDREKSMAEWETNRPVKTDYVSFKTEEDLRRFIDCLAGKSCP